MSGQKTEELEGAVYTLGDDIGFVQLTHKHKDPGLSVVNAARVSYNTRKNAFDEKDARLCKFLWEHEHHSPYRHQHYSFRIKVPLFVARQWMKYTVASTWRSYEADGQEVSLEVFDHFYTDTSEGTSWNELSSRYSEMKPEFFIPAAFRTNPQHGNKQTSEALPDDFAHKEWESWWYECVMASYNNYQAALGAGIAKELARTLLPQNMYTQVYWTVSFQAILWFLHQRLKPDAQHEIRAYAQGIKSLIQEDLDQLGIEF